MSLVKTTPGWINNVKHVALYSPKTLQYSRKEKFPGLELSRTGPFQNLHLRSFGSWASVTWSWCLLVSACPRDRFSGATCPGVAMTPIKAFGDMTFPKLTLSWLSKILQAQGRHSQETWVRTHPWSLLHWYLLSSLSQFSAENPLEINQSEASSDLIGNQSAY